MRPSNKYLMKMEMLIVAEFLLEKLCLLVDATLGTPFAVEAY